MVGVVWSHVTASTYACDCIESGSPAFDEFLELMGERVRMKGFNKYRAQLDNKSESRCPEVGG